MREGGREWQMREGGVGGGGMGGGGGGRNWVGGRRGREEGEELNC